MRKVMTVTLWLGLAACLALVISLSGQKRALEREWKDETRKNEVLQALYDQMKEEWTEKEAALTLKNDTLTRDAKALSIERDALTAALKTARLETQAQRQTADALTAERETASGRLSALLDMLLTPVPGLSSADAPAKDGSLPRHPRTTPLAKNGVQPVPFAE